MSDTDPLVRMQDWYASNCDGDWEHSFGVKIETLDNPGWRIRFDIEGTSVEGRVLDRVIADSSAEHWLHYWSDGSAVHAACGPRRLRDALGTILDLLSEWRTAG